VPRNRRLRLVLAMVGGIAALLCLGGVGIFVAVYDNATKIDRTAPDAVVDSFLRAYLVDRDDAQAALFMCKSPTDLSSMSSLRDEQLRREREFDVRVSVTWSSLTVLGNAADRRQVKAGLVIAGSAEGRTRSRRTEQWTFDVVDENGWRVCGATKAS
jgi:hypothetical protein